MGRSISLDVNTFAAAAAAPTVTPTGLATPGAPVITQGGTPGSTAYGYKVVAKHSDGGYTAAGAVGSTATGPATCGETDNNIVTWGAVPNAVTYDVYRTVGGTTQGKIGTVTAPTVALADTGLAGSGSVPAAATQTYKVVAKTADGHAAAGGAGTTAVGYPSMSASCKNALSWAAVPGATGYDVYRTAGGPSQGKIGSTTSPTVALDDTGLAGDAGTAPTTNTTGIGDTTTVTNPERPRAVEIGGTFVATLQVEVSCDGGNSWTLYGSARSSKGIVRIPSIAKKVRIRETAYTSGTPTASIVVQKPLRGA